ncbi:MULTISPECIES: MarR family transcriptional regulator [Streptomyces]|uniref:MarR family transcriptional regulator n=1 Tax=Streptomyces lonegramiae TaxID=3075524 RepID=A0ABU2XV14_9ACTN|nr:MarR family transcriptional regulator [Streptomyces sp. DSM 41529]MDT0549736.1 MarR family transcriptional regulator [Streptomyces sp. DSM 41529]
MSSEAEARATDAQAGCGVREIRGLVTELSRRMDAHRRSRIAELGLTPTQAKALEELGEPKTARELAAVLCCEPPNVTYVMDKMEKQGLVVRQPHPTDRRAKQLVLTEEGRELRLDLLRRMGKDSPLDHLTDEGRDELRAQLLKALDRVG